MVRSAGGLPIKTAIACFELCPRDADIDRFRFCRENLSPRRRDVGNRGSAGVILILLMSKVFL